MALGNAWASPEYTTAQTFKEACVATNRSLLWPEEAIWTRSNLVSFCDTFFAASPKGDSFVDSLALQLESSPRELSAMAADLLILYYLFPHDDKLGRDKKLQKVRAFATLRGIEISSQRLDACFSLGVGYPGSYYLAKPRAIVNAFASIIGEIKATQAFDASMFANLARRLSAQNSCDPTALHTLACLFFPEQFESIISGSHRERIISHYREFATGVEDSDEALRLIRNALQTQLRREFSFYDTDVRALWDPSEEATDPIPPMEKLLLPLLQLVESGGERKESDLVGLLADDFRLSPEDRQRRVPSGSELVFNNRVRWAKVYLRQARLLEIPREGYVILTGRGKELLAEEHSQLTRSALKRYPEFVSFVNRSSGREDPEAPSAAEINALQGNVWIEKTLIEGRSDRGEGPNALGKALWSPIRDSSGKDIYRFMRDVRPGDTVLHLTDNRGFTAISRVKEPATTFGGVKNTEWGEQESYRVELTAFQKLDPALMREVFFHEPYGSKLRALRAQGKTNLFYTNGLDLVQGGYLTPAPPELLAILNEAYADLSAKTLVDAPTIDPVSASEVAGDLSDLQLTTLWREEELNAIIDAVSPTNERPSRQIIFSGPPGTGKTWAARQIAKYLASGDVARCKLIQFHPSFSYEQFVEGLRPEGKDGAITFNPVPGILLEVANQCRHSSDPWFLIIDELNRANLPRVFGELMYLLEYRDDAVDLPYTRGFKLPENLYIFATMNTADRSARAIDLALRRRFEIFDCPPRRDILERYYELNTNQVSDLFDGFDRLNARLADDIDRHHTVGHTYFMAPVFSPKTLRNAWERKLLPLIEEYFFDQPDKAKEYSLQGLWPSLGA
jgi:hypothetical protein